MDPVTLSICFIGVFVLGVLAGMVFTVHAKEGDYQNRRRRWNDHKE